MYDTPLVLSTALVDKVSYPCSNLINFQLMITSSVKHIATPCNAEVSISLHLVISCYKCYYKILHRLETVKEEPRKALALW